MLWAPKGHRRLGHRLWSCPHGHVQADIDYNSYIILAFVESIVIIMNFKKIYIFKGILYPFCKIPLDKRIIAIYKKWNTCLITYLSDNVSRKYYAILSNVLHFLSSVIAKCLNFKINNFSSTIGFRISIFRIYSKIDGFVMCDFVILLVRLIETVNVVVLITTFPFSCQNSVVYKILINQALYRQLIVIN